MDESNDGTIAAFDVGDRRIGVALARLDTRLPNPHGVIINDKDVWDNLDQLLKTNNVREAVIGLPRGMDGQDTQQTSKIRQFHRQFSEKFRLPTYLQDEALTSRLAEEELAKKTSRYNKGMVDAIAATIIMDDYLRDRG